MTHKNWVFWIDRGGTFTDCMGKSPDNKIYTTKILSSDEAPLLGIQHILNMAPSNSKPSITIKMGTTIATNALLEQKGSPFTLVTNNGFGDLLYIGTQQRPDLFNIRIQKPAPLFQSVLEVNERVSQTGDILQPLDISNVKSKLKHLYESGIRHLAIVYMFGYLYPDHEIQTAQLAKTIGFNFVLTSHQCCNEMGFLGRMNTTSLDTYLTPIMDQYAQWLSSKLLPSKLFWMQSNGGLVTSERLRGVRSILSGPVGGAIAVEKLGQQLNLSQLIGFDMGGTSTDVCCYDKELDITFNPNYHNMPLFSPMMNIHTIAAGGGSICRWLSGRLVVGPESSGADPGPICYGRTDPKNKVKSSVLTITDMNAFLGRLQPENFPFPLHLDPIENALKLIQAQLTKDGLHWSLPQIAQGYIDVVNQNMATAIKEVTQKKGKDPRQFGLVVYGGAGGQHACDIAQLLGIKTLWIHPYSGLFSAYGIGQSDQIWEDTQAIIPITINSDVKSKTKSVFQSLKETGLKALQPHHLKGLIDIQQVGLRYTGTQTTIPIDYYCKNWQTEFETEFFNQFGYLHPDRSIDCVMCRLKLILPNQDIASINQFDSNNIGVPFKTTRLFTSTNQQLDVPVFYRTLLQIDQKINGPALILDGASTLFLQTNCRLTVHQQGILSVDIVHPTAQGVCPVDPVGIEIFGNLFMSIGTQMGYVLQQTAVSPNIKDRQDFSCALFNASGHLIANAPHIPVHLGAMSESVKAVIHEISFSPGDAVILNNPYKGGSHLPDITVVTPFFLNPSDPTPFAFLANRAHHADIGGLTPGSMPPKSTKLEQEGVIINPIKIVQNGQINTTLLKHILNHSLYPARRPADNQTDIEAQLAANQKGVLLLKELVDYYSGDTVIAFFEAIQHNAYRQVTQSLNRLASRPFKFKDTLDVGLTIAVSGFIKNGHLLLDFSETSIAHQGNFNAPISITQSAVLYILRCIVSDPIPLNEGCLMAVSMILPNGCCLHPIEGHAVAAGNVETSQRIVDVVFGALGIAAASQGTMNNITFGTTNFGYYETICGGVGASHAYQGADAVHTHMTNSQLTDPELFEWMFPARILETAIRTQSGGSGKWAGGNGCIRRYEWLAPLQVSILSDRRTHPPFGLNGGQPGKQGQNIRILPDGTRRLLPARCTYSAQAGEQLIIETPGGGGYGQINN